MKITHAGALCRQREHLERTVSGLKSRLAKAAEEHDKVYVKIMKDNVTLISEINELREELRSTRTRVKEYKAQLATGKKSNKTRLDPGDAPEHEGEGRYQSKSSQDEFETLASP